MKACAKGAGLASLVALLLALSSCGTTDWTLTLANQTGNPLTWVPVVTDPPPPHREISDRSLASGNRLPIDLDDFNPIWWDPITNFGLTIQHQFAQSPRELFVVYYQFKLPPGEETADPVTQPTKLGDKYFPVDEASGEKKVRIRVGPLSQPDPIEIFQEP